MTKPVDPLTLLGTANAYQGMQGQAPGDIREHVVPQNVTQLSGLRRTKSHIELVTNPKAKQPLARSLIDCTPHPDDHQHFAVSHNVDHLWKELRSDDHECATHRQGMREKLFPELVIPDTKAFDAKAFKNLPIEAFKPKAVIDMSKAEALKTPIEKFQYFNDFYAVNSRIFLVTTEEGMKRAGKAAAKTLADNRTGAVSYMLNFINGQKVEGHPEQNSPMRMLLALDKSLNEEMSKLPEDQRTVIRYNAAVLRHEVPQPGPDGVTPPVQMDRLVDETIQIKNLLRKPSLPEDQKSVATRLNKIGLTSNEVVSLHSDFKAQFTRIHEHNKQVANDPTLTKVQKQAMLIDIDTHVGETQVSGTAGGRKPKSAAQAVIDAIETCAPSEKDFPDPDIRPKLILQHVSSVDFNSEDGKKAAELIRQHDCVVGRCLTSNDVLGYTPKPGSTAKEVKEDGIGIMFGADDPPAFGKTERDEYRRLPSEGFTNADYIDAAITGFYAIGRGDDINAKIGQFKKAVAAELEKL